MDRVDDLGAVDALEVRARDPEIRIMSELPLDHNERHVFVRHLDRVRVPQLGRREPASDARRGSSKDSALRWGVTGGGKLFA